MKQKQLYNDISPIWLLLVFEVYMNIAICDENIKNGEYVKEQTIRYLLENNVNANCFAFNNAADIMASEENFDMAILETHFQAVSGIKIGSFLKRKNEAIFLIYIAKDYSYLDDAFDVGAKRYLIKPISESAVYSSLKAAFDFLNEESAECYLKSNGTIKRILKSSIIYLEISGRKTKVVTKSETLTSKMKIQDWQKRLDPSLFASPHKSFVVNLKHISECKRFGGQYYVCMVDNKYIPITRTRKSEFEKAYYKYLKHKNLI
jgi:DNA-binding LytR/AlgR family response regulator